MCARRLALALALVLPLASCAAPSTPPAAPSAADTPEETSAESATAPAQEQAAAEPGRDSKAVDETRLHSEVSDTAPAESSELMPQPRRTEGDAGDSLAARGLTAPDAVPTDVTAPPPDAICLRSGLCWRVLRAGSVGASPTDEDKVVVHYSGWTRDGSMFDSSIERGTPETFGVARVIRGWTTMRSSCSKSYRHPRHLPMWLFARRRPPARIQVSAMSS